MALFRSHLATTLACCAAAAGAFLFGASAQAAPRVHTALRTQTHRPTPPDSYLQYKVYSVAQLIQQVSSNAAVRQRFARHFQIPESRVVSYMRANLVESYVPRTDHYTVYCVRRNGQFYPVRQTFKRGTKVFALRNGDPVMKWVCGNPLSKFLPAVQVRNLPAPRLPYKVSPSIQELMPADTVNVIVPTEIAAPVVQPLVPIPVSIASSLAAPLVGHAGRSLLPFLLPVALLGVHSGSSSGGGVPIAAVPEPGTLAYALAALPLMLAAMRRRRAQAKQG